jgi:hypothetical protein
VSPAWDPPAFPLVGLGAVALGAWLVLSPPLRRSRLSAALQITATILLALALVNAGWRPGSSRARPRLTVLVDRSASMAEVGSEGTSRLESAREWMEGEAFSRLSGGWQVEIDSFGGATTDPAAAIEAASAALPAAILVVSDGRATGGRVSGTAPMPLYAWTPGPVKVSDVAVLELAIEEGDERRRVAIEVAAVGGAPTASRSLSILVDGKVVARARAPDLAAGERRQIRLDLPDPGREERVVEAQLGEPADAVAGNDARARVWRAAPPGRTLLVGLAPGWEIGFLGRALETSGTGPVDAFWGATEGSLRSVDGGGAGSWSDLDPERYESVWLIGDPSLLGASGRRWIDRFAAAGGHGIFWGASGPGGELAGLRAPASGATAPAPPVLTDSGRRWLEAVVGELGATPDGTRAWPPLEGLSADRVELPVNASILVRAGGRPVAWSVERNGNRHVVALGTGWYRLELAGGVDRESPGRQFWRAWTEGAARWLSAASPAERPLLAMPADGRVRQGSTLEARLAGGGGRVEWRVVPAAGGAATASGVAEADADRIVVDPMPPGAWRLEVTVAGRREVRAFAVEAWVPDLARTEADPASLAAAARASGGEVLAAEPTPLPSAAVARASEAGPVVGLGLVPWAFLFAAGLLLAHWAVAARAR